MASKIAEELGIKVVGDSCQLPNGMWSFMIKASFPINKEEVHEILIDGSKDPRFIFRAQGDAQKVLKIESENITRILLNEARSSGLKILEYEKRGRMR